MALPPVRREITVDVSQARAFRVFTEEQGAWWPLASHHIGEKMAETAVIEPHAGGRWFERAADGTECQWGKVLEWDPPGRVLLAWQIGPLWKFDENFTTEVEVRFVSLGPARTRIELEHRRLEGFGSEAAKMREQIDSEGGWGMIIGQFAARATRLRDKGRI